jgi:hypothetical protein
VCSGLSTDYAIIVILLRSCALLQVVQGKPAWVWLSKLGKGGSSKQHSSSSGSSSKRSSSNTQRNIVFIGLSPLTAAAQSAAVAAAAAASANGKFAAVDNAYYTASAAVLPIAHVFSWPLQHASVFPVQLLLS